jgi:hypothetical protein
MSARKDEKSPEQSRKPYRKPKLVDHGDIAAVTRANKGGHASDGSGKPATKAPTGPGA